MSYTATALKVMIATPSDVPAERLAIRQALEDWNNAHSEARHIVLMPVGWDTHSVPHAGDRPQAAINKQVLKGCDILVAAFWTRVGTPTGDHASGTIEEIEEYLKSGQHAMIYFSSAPLQPDLVDPAQYAKLKEFKASRQATTLYATYSDLAEFKALFYRHLQIKLNGAEFGGGAAEATPEVSPTPAMSLSEDAKGLLKMAASKDGSIMYLRHLGGAVLGTTGDNLVVDGNPRSLAHWEGVLKELVRNELILGNSAGSNFRLTAGGYSVADQIS